MPHINKLIDYTAEVFVICDNKLLLRKHDKYGIWLSVGGHIELDENPNEAAIREVKEKVGLEIKLWNGNQLVDYSDHRYRELIPPVFMNVHQINEEHRHVALCFIGFASTQELNIPELEMTECR